MSFKEIANSGVLWTCVIVGIIIVIALTVFYFRLCYKKAIEMYEKAEICYQKRQKDSKRCH